MGFVIVLAIAVAVGLLVYRITDPGEVAMDTAPPEPDGLGEPGASAPQDVGQWTGGGAGDRAALAPIGIPGDGPDMIHVAPETDIPGVSARRSWSSRVNGGLGLVVAIAVGAAAIAFMLYAVGTLIARLVSAGVDAGAVTS